LGSENYHKQISPDEFIAASKFLKRLEFEARYAPGSEVVLAR
jgi:hypothetical protein